MPFQFLPFPCRDGVGSQKLNLQKKLNPKKTKSPPQKYNSTILDLILRGIDVYPVCNHGLTVGKAQSTGTARRCSRYGGWREMTGGLSWPKRGTNRPPHPEQSQEGPAAVRDLLAVSLSIFISHKVFVKSFCKSQFPRKSVKLFFILATMKYKLTDLCGN